MSNVVTVQNVSKVYPKTAALVDVSFSLAPNTIYGLFGRNGAGKSTLMSILTAQTFKSAGTVRVFGADPVENAAVLQRICFVRESQVYPADFLARNALSAASIFFPNWDAAFAAQLVKEFQLPVERRIRRLSRGQLSAVGIIIGLASRAELTFFDEPYLGLDAIARQIFYDRLLEDYSEHPRTIVLSSHLIDEVADLLEHVLVLDKGRLIMDESAESVRGQAVNLVGDSRVVEEFAVGRNVIHRERLGGVAAVTILGQLTREERQELSTKGVELGPVSLQQLLVRTGQQPATAGMKGAA